MVSLSTLRQPEETMTTIDRPKLDRPCPTWCTSPHGHGWDGAQYTVVSRGHSGPVASGVDIDGMGWDLAVGATEFADAEIDWDEDDNWTLESEPDSSIFDPPAIDIEVRGRLNSAQARELAAALSTMANELDGVPR